MADKVGILIISKCLSSAAIIDTFSRSDKYRPEFYVAERQVNPHNFERAKAHQLVPDLSIPEIARFAGKYKQEIAFGLADTEDFVTAGGRDILEKEVGVPMICVTEKFAIEKSKADQRLLFEQICPEVNPRFKVFDPKEHAGRDPVIADLKRLNQEFGGVVIKPDAPARGAGVGVWGSDFQTEEEMVAFFLNVYSKGRVVVEERIEGEESSFHAFSDGKHFVPAPLVRDYKRALEDGKGRLTGGMGSYRGPGNSLPFLPASEWDKVVGVEERAFARWRGRGSEPGLRGIVLYDALMHCEGGFKILERNSRGGNTESINLLTTMDDDLADVCFRMIDGTLRGIRFKRLASVVTCAVPVAYGTSYASPADGRVDLRGAYRLQDSQSGRTRVFPMDVRLQDSSTIIGSSRTVAVAGIGRSIKEARALSLAAVNALRGPLRHRKDVASPEDIRRSTSHLMRVRGRGAHSSRGR